MLAVALRKESVDRNFTPDSGEVVTGGSLSARRAWIEIVHVLNTCKQGRGRSPQGERG